MKSNSTSGKIALKTVLFICLFNLICSSILLKNNSKTEEKNIKEKYPENILAKTESRKLLVNLWNKDPQSKSNHGKHQKIDFFGTTPDHFGILFINILKIRKLTFRTWNQNSWR